MTVSEFIQSNRRGSVENDYQLCVEAEVSYGTAKKAIKGDVSTMKLSTIKRILEATGGASVRLSVMLDGKEHRLSF